MDACISSSGLPGPGTCPGHGAGSFTLQGSDFDAFYCQSRLEVTCRQPSLVDLDV